MENKGEFSVEFKAGKGNTECNLTFQNADVGMPIFSIGNINDDNCETMFRKDNGTIYNLTNGEEIDFIRASGVYFVKMKVERALVEPAGFARHGRAA